VNQKRKSDDRDTKLGAVIKAARERRGMLRTELANALGVSVPMIYRWEDGTYRLTVSTFIEIAQVLKVSANKLLSDAFKS